MQVQRAGRGQRRRRLTVDRALHGDRAGAKPGHRARAGIGLVIQVDVACLHPGVAGVQARQQAGVVRRARRYQDGAAVLDRRAACAAAEDIEGTAARRAGVGDADRLLLGRSEMDIAEVDRAGGVEHRHGGGLDGAGDHQRLGVHRLREAGIVAVGAVEDDRLGVDARTAGGERDIKRRCVARTNLDEAAGAAVAERRVAAGGERTAQPVRRAGSRVEQAQIGRQRLPGDGGAEIEGEDVARLAHAAGAGQLAERRGGVVVDGDVDRHIDDAEIGCAEAVDTAAVADGVYPDMAVDGAGRGGGNANAQRRGVAIARHDVRGAAGGADAAGLADHDRVQSFRPDIGQRGVGDR